ncbi:hypothetical protein D3C80_1665300 [compost metagenome]
MVCWRRWCRVARAWPSSPYTSISSSATWLAGQKPNTARALISFSSISLSSISRASLYSAVAASPTTSSVRMRGNLPARSQEMKNGVQSMYSARVRRSMSSSTLTPVKEGTAGW